MDFVRLVFLFLHFAGMASLLGGFLTQMSPKGTPTRRVNNAMVHGALTQLVTGLALVGVDQALGGEVAPNNAKVAVKLAVLLVILALILANRRKARLGNQPYLAIGGLTLVNLGVAVFWT